MLKSWGVVQLVGHLTVNEDGVGSSPTAPANQITNSTVASIRPSDIGRGLPATKVGVFRGGPTVWDREDMKKLEALLIRVAKPSENGVEPEFLRRNITNKFRRALTEELDELLCFPFALRHRSIQLSGIGGILLHRSAQGSHAPRFDSLAKLEETRRAFQQGYEKSAHPFELDLDPVKIWQRL